MNLPYTVLPSGELARIRNQANMFMTEDVNVCSISLAYSDTGREIVTSGLLFTASGYVGRISGKDQELLRELGLTGMLTDTFVTVLLPFGNQIAVDNVIHTQGKEFQVIWSNADTQDSVQIYEKAIVRLGTIQGEKRKYGAG